MIKIILLKIWRIFPGWLQIVLSRFVRPLFQVFAVAVIFNENREVLLVKSTYQRFHPWGLPGGSLEYGESPEKATLREVWEETGLHIEIERLLLVKTWKPDKVGLYYLCRITGGEFLPSDEVLEMGYFKVENLPDIGSMDIGMIELLYRMMEHELA